MPKFSIIVPVYNVAPYLRECLGSVLAQSFTDWECLCVNDGSTDDSGAILDEYAAKDSRFRVFHKPNGGVSSARNLALDNMKGEYVAFVDGDDWILTDWFEKIHSLIQQTPGVDWVRMENQDWQDGKYIHKKKLFTGYRIIQGVDILLFGWKQISRNGVPFINVYRSEILKKIRFATQLVMHEDTIFCLSLLPFIGTCCFSNYDGYVYRILSTSAVRRRKSVRASLNFEQALLAVWDSQKIIAKDSQKRRTKYYGRLVVKDIAQWYSVRDSKSKTDGIQLREICHKAWKSGAISFSLKNWKQSIRLFGFIFSGNLKCFISVRAFFY